MKLYKMILILVIVAICTVGGMWTLGLIGSPEATESLNKSIAMILIVGAGLGAIFLVAGNGKNKSPEQSDSNQQGPKF